MKSTVKRVLIASALVACSGPTPTDAPTRSPSPPATPSPTSTLADPSPAAEATGLRPEQLVAIEEGFVAARWATDDLLELVWVRPDGPGFALVRLAAVTAQARGNTISTYAVICPPGAGLSRKFFLFGQASHSAQVLVSGPVAAGGVVVERAYALAFEEEDPERAAAWTLSDSYGRLLATSYRPWFTAPPPPPTAGSLCSLAADH